MNNKKYLAWFINRDDNDLSALNDILRSQNELSFSKFLN